MWQINEVPDGVYTFYFHNLVHREHPKPQLSSQWYWLPVIHVLALVFYDPVISLCRLTLERRARDLISSRGIEFELSTVR